MAHPGRGRISTKRGYRSIPRREECRLLNRQEEELVFVPDMFWSEVAYKDQVIVVNLRNETRTWKIPVIQAAGVKPLTGYRIRTLLEGTLWEILAVQLSANETWSCVSVKMNEHDEVIP